MTPETSSSWYLNMLGNVKLRKTRRRTKKNPSLCPWVPVYFFEARPLTPPPSSKCFGKDSPWILGQELAGKWHSLRRWISHGKIHKERVWLVCILQMSRVFSSLGDIQVNRRVAVFSPAGHQLASETCHPCALVFDYAK